MKDSNPNNELEKTSKHAERNPILLMGIGIFGGLAIGSFAFLFARILKDIFFNITISPIYTEIFAELVNFATYIFGIIIIVKIIKSGKISELNIFKFSILFLIIAQILQFIEPMIISKFRTDSYLNNSSQYYDFLNENPYYYTISVISGIILYVIVGIIIYLKRK